MPNIGELTKMEDIVREQAIATMLPSLCDKYDVNPEEMRARKGSLIVPALFPDGEECYLKITVSVPRGARARDDDGNFYYEPYDGIDEVEAYKRHREKLAARKAANALKREGKKARERRLAAEAQNYTADA